MRRVFQRIFYKVCEDKSRYLKNRSIISQRQHCWNALFFFRIIARCRTRRHAHNSLHPCGRFYFRMLEGIINNARNNLERSIDDVVRFAWKIMREKNCQREEFEIEDATRPIRTDPSIWSQCCEIHLTTGRGMIDRRDPFVTVRRTNRVAHHPPFALRKLLPRRRAFADTQKSCKSPTAPQSIAHI